MIYFQLLVINRFKKFKKKLKFILLHTLIVFVEKLLSDSLTF